MIKEKKFYAKTIGKGIRWRCPCCVTKSARKRMAKASRHTQGRLISDLVEERGAREIDEKESSE